MEDKYVLKLNNLSVSYKVYEGLLKVIPGLDMTVMAGQRVGLIGEAGCGKTTVLKTVASILQCPPAVIKYDALEVCGKKAEGKAGVRNVRKTVSMIFQDPSTSLNPTLKISTQMSDILKSQFPGQKREDYQRRMLESLQAVAMPAPERVLDSYPVQLSGGMRQRVCIAMSLMKDSEFILADEPTTALDVTIEEQILDLLDRLVREKNKSLILVSHALGAVRKITERLFVMYAGNIVETGPTRELFASPRHPYTIGLLAATPKLTGEGIADGIEGDIPSYLHPPQGCRFADRCPRKTDLCLEKAPVLEPVEEKPGWYVACHHAEGKVRP